MTAEEKNDNVEVTAADTAEEKKAPAKKAPAKKAPAKKAPAKKAASDKAPAKKPAAKKPAAKKAPAEKPKAEAAAAEVVEAKTTETKPAAKKPAAKKVTSMIKITQVKSGIGYQGRQKRVLAGLGLGKIGRTVTRKDDEYIRGMVNKISHLVRVEKVEG
jgi:ribosomal protein L30